MPQRREPPARSTTLSWPVSRAAPNLRTRSRATSQRPHILPPLSPPSAAGVSSSIQRHVFPRSCSPRSTIPDPRGLLPSLPQRNVTPRPASRLDRSIELGRVGMAPLSNAQKSAITQQFMQLTGAPDRVASRVRHESYSHARLSPHHPPSFTCSAVRIGTSLPSSPRGRHLGFHYHWAGDCLAAARGPAEGPHSRQLSWDPSCSADCNRRAPEGRAA